MKNFHKTLEDHQFALHNEKIRLFLYNLFKKGDLDYDILILLILDS